MYVKDRKGFKLSENYLFTTVFQSICTTFHTPMLHQCFQEENYIAYLCHQLHNKTVSKHIACHQVGSQTNSIWSFQTKCLSLQKWLQLMAWKMLTPFIARWWLNKELSYLQMHRKETTGLEWTLKETYSSWNNTALISAGIVNFLLSSQYSAALWI